MYGAGVVNISGIELTYFRTLQLSIEHCWDVDDDPETNCAPLDEVNSKLPNIFVDVSAVS